MKGSNGVSSVRDSHRKNGEATAKKQQGLTQQPKGRATKEKSIMMRSMWRFGIVTLAAVLVIGALASTSQAAYPYRGGVHIMPNYSVLPNPNWYVGPGLTVNQYAYNVRVLNNAYLSVPSYGVGYTPYYGSVYPYYAPAYPYGYGYSAYPYGLYNYGYNPYYP
jgi:hypothetical protein